MAITKESLPQLHEVLTKKPLKLYGVSELEVAQFVIRKEDEIDRRIMEILKVEGFEKGLVIDVCIDNKGKEETHDKVVDTLMDRYKDAGWTVGGLTRDEDETRFQLITTS